MNVDMMKDEINALDFVQLELLLYLDVHTADEAARAQWSRNAKQLQKLKEQYTAQTGMIWPMQQSQDGGLPAWVEEPWPWEINH